jgi:hypothetical protein
MFTDRLDGDRLFGRIFELQLECARCGEVHHLTSPGRTPSIQAPGRKRHWSPGPYNFRTGRFTCPSCGATFGVGVLVYPIDDRHGEVAPEDWCPTWEQAIALRNQASCAMVVGQKNGYWNHPEWKAQDAIRRSHRAPEYEAMEKATGWKWRDPKNTVVRQGCLCKIRVGVQGKAVRPRFTVNPACPVHGDGVTATSADSQSRSPSDQDGH